MKHMVSIIVPCYNQACFLPEALDSVLAQTYPDWECIIVNDGSHDNTEDVANRYCEIDNRFRYLSQPNQGLANSRNNGIKHSIGKYILPLDADDKLKEDFVSKCVEVLEKDPLCKLVYTEVERFGAQNGIWEFPKYEYKSFIWNNCIVATAMFRRIDFDATIGYNPNMKYGLEDWDFWLSLLSEKDKVLQISQPLFCYRIRENSMHKSMGNVFSDMLRQVYNNHASVYKKYASNIIVYHNKLYERESELLALKQELTNARNSYSYKVGRFILTPFRVISNAFRRRLHI